MGEEKACKRERLGSRLGFILLGAGCAIGIGNVWKFPYMVGQNGGGAFVLLYLFFLLVIAGIPVMTIEFSPGPCQPKKPCSHLSCAGPQGEKMVYSWLYGHDRKLSADDVLHHGGGWMIQYFLHSPGKFNGMSAEEVGQAS